MGGGGGKPPFPLRVFWQNDFPLIYYILGSEMDYCSRWFSTKPNQMNGKSRAIVHNFLYLFPDDGIGLDGN